MACGLVIRQQGKKCNENGGEEWGVTASHPVAQSASGAESGMLQPHLAGCLSHPRIGPELCSPKYCLRNAKDTLSSRIHSQPHSEMDYQVAGQKACSTVLDLSSPLPPPLPAIAGLRWHLRKTSCFLAGKRGNGRRRRNPVEQGRGAL